MRDKVKLAAVQMDPEIMKVRGNLDKILSEMRVAADNGADLIVFPECALTGYVFNSREEAVPFMETIPGPVTDELTAGCRALGVHAVVGLLEIQGDKCFNAAVLLGPEGLVGRYRKNHLPFLGIDRFLDPGDEPFQAGRLVARIYLPVCLGTRQSDQ